MQFREKITSKTRLVGLLMTTLAAAIIMVAPVPGHALPIITFSENFAGGSVTQSGSTLTGSLIPIDLMFASGTTPFGSFVVTGGVLGFTAFLNGSNQVLPGGSISISGAIPVSHSEFKLSSLGLSRAVCMSRLPLFPVSRPRGPIRNPWHFLQLFQLTQAPTLPTSGFGIGVGGPSGFIPLHTTIINSGLSVPETGSVLLLGLGLAGLGLLSMKRRKAA